MPPLDALAARAVHLARCFERAVNDPGPWAIATFSDPVQAEQVLSPAGVTFRARFPAVCRRFEGQVLAELSCRGEPVAYRYIEVPDEQDYEVAWGLDADAVALA